MLTFLFKSNVYHPSGRSLLKLTEGSSFLRRFILRGFFFPASTNYFGSR